MKKLIKYSLSILFLVSGLIKVIQPEHFLYTIIRFYKSSAEDLLSISLAVGIFEILIALLVTFFLSKYIVRFSIFFLLIFFFLFHIYSKIEKFNCGCFGDFDVVNSILPYVLFMLIPLYYKHILKSCRSTNS